MLTDSSYLSEMRSQAYRVRPSALICWVSALAVVSLLCGCSCRSTEGRQDALQSSNRATLEAKRTQPALSRASLETTNGLAAIQAFPSWMPLSRWVAELVPADQKVLLPQYRRENLTNKLALTIGLGFIGDENVVPEFKKTLFETKVGH